VGFYATLNPLTQQSNPARAIAWQGNSSGTDINPGAYSSGALGISHGQIVGSAAFDALRPTFARAILWQGQNRSGYGYVDLNPASAVSSSAWSTNGVQQVGAIDTEVFNGNPCVPIGSVAGVWHGSAQSFERLPIPTGYSGSFGSAPPITSRQQILPLKIFLRDRLSRNSSIAGI